MYKQQNKIQNQPFFSRRSFIKHLGVGAIATASGLALPSLGQYKSSSESAAFEILAIGDSVIWGQGLKPENKFISIVKEWIEKEIFEGHRQVHLYYGESHSGATIHPGRGKPHKRFHGEVNDESPSIFEQVKSSLEYYRHREESHGGPIVGTDVNLIILDGGINDVRAVSLADPTKSIKSIRYEANEYCKLAMSHFLLPEVVRAFPNAQIVVTGYFPLFSNKSNGWEIVYMLRRLFASDKSKLNTILPSTKSSSGIFDLKEKLSVRSKVWTESSDIALQASADYINQNRYLPGYDSFSATNPRVVFASPDFSDENSYAAPNSWLWQIGNQGRTNDEMWSVRQTACNVRKWPHDKFICHRAALFHPNRLGASAYAEAIKNKLKDFFPSA